MCLEALFLFWAWNTFDYFNFFLMNSLKSSLLTVFDLTGSVLSFFVGAIHCFNLLQNALTEIFIFIMAVSRLRYKWIAYGYCENKILILANSVNSQWVFLAFKTKLSHIWHNYQVPGFWLEALITKRREQSIINILWRHGSYDCVSQGWVLYMAATR